MLVAQEKLAERLPATARRCGEGGTGRAEVIGREEEGNLGVRGERGRAWRT